MTAKANGLILWEGISRIDRQAPIVVIVTGIARRSKNGKTGSMLQTWIVRADIDPFTAQKRGLDVPVCGNCPMRKGACYVLVQQAPLQIWKTYKRGAYPNINDWSIFDNSITRFGAYGDPTAAPFGVWANIAQRCKSHTGYSHQWYRPEFQPYRRLLMASVETEDQVQLANALGWRTFRTKTEDMPILENEINCPASKEAGFLKTCLDCRACRGNPSLSAGRRNIVINVHGGIAKLSAAKRTIGELNYVGTE